MLHHRPYSSAMRPLGTPSTSDCWVAAIIVRRSRKKTVMEFDGDRIHHMTKLRHGELVMKKLGCA